MLSVKWKVLYTLAKLSVEKKNPKKALHKNMPIEINSRTN